MDNKIEKPTGFKILQAEKHVDQELGFLCRYVNSDTEVARLHGHTYYEIFMGINGKYLHTVNSVCQKLTEGTIVFVRDFDVHAYSCVNGEKFEFINLAFSKDFFNGTADFLGEGFKREKLFKTHLPPMVNIFSHDSKRLFREIMEINSCTDKKLLKSRMKVMLAKILSDYFMDYRERTDTIPPWLEMACEKMKKPANFIAGSDKMCEISGRSREHLSRSMRKHYGVSTTEFVNELRLSYSSALLITSDLSVTDICYESGFDNISWFYRKFEERFGITPSKYRKMNR